MIKAKCSEEAVDVVHVEYTWRHENHIPGSIEDLETAPISRHARDMIHSMVDQNMNWASIQNVLRVDEKSLQDMMTGDGNGIPAILRTGYNRVYYAMRTCINKRAKFNKGDLESSLEHWSEKIGNEDGYSKYVTMDNIQEGMFLYAFTSSWQLQNDCFLYTLVVRSNVTGKGAAVCWMITNSNTHHPVKAWLNW
ncbi:hypothetical protein K492DRAFT_223953 [Lichtheimia hyalospora FSU 10163]|nr:hypothetical protein K492DRAFT_223953 [Lichtheimia hyalospora FSU 10163]